MSLLAEQFRKKVESFNDYAMKCEKEADVGYSTGFLNFDFRNSSVIHVKNEERGLDYSYYSIGITDGSMTTVIGRTGCGKSTWVTQVAANMVRPFKTACIFQDTIEAGMQDSRLEVLTGFTGDELQSRLITRNTGINSENFYERIKLIHDMRVENREAYLYDTGLLDYRGEKIYKMEPCVYILDSLALLRPKKLTEEDDMSGQMAVTSAAKMNTEIIRRIIPFLKSANINLFIINHILKNVNLNQYQATKAQVQYLKQDERCPGGDTALYLANNLIRLDDSKLKPEVFGIDGSLITMTLLKSRTNKAGQSVTLVYNQSCGYDADLSLFVMLKDAKRIGVGGAWMWVGDHKDMKFQQKTLKKKLKEDPEFRKIFIAESLDVLKAMCDADATADREESNVVSNEIADMMSTIKIEHSKAA